MKYTKYLSVLLLVVSAVLAVIFYASDGSEAMVTTIINWALVLSCVALAGAVLMPLFFSNGKGKKGVLVKVGFIAVLCVVSYLCATGDPVVGSRIEATESAWKYTDAGLILTGLLFAVAVLSILFGSVISNLRNK